MKIIFFGSSDFAEPSLRALAAAGHAPAVAVTHPDRPIGRGRKIHPAPIRLVAEDVGVECVQPDNVNTEEFGTWLAEQEADLALVISFGQIFSPELLAIPKVGCFNLHGSLLPAWRGAAPIQHAMLSGIKETGVTVIKMTEGMDEGPMLLKRTQPIADDITGVELRAQMAELGGKTFVEAMKVLAKGKFKLEEQDPAQVTMAPKLQREDGHLDWNQKANQIDLRIRGLLPWPGAFTRHTIKRLQVLEGEVEDWPSTADPGTVLSAGEEGIRVATGDGVYRILKIKPDGSRAMNAGEWVRGARLGPDTRFV